MRTRAKRRSICATAFNRLQLPPTAAADFIDAFEAQLEALEAFPEGRALVADYELARKGYRWCPVGNFMLFYTVDADTGMVYVERLLYGARDWKSLL